MKATVGIPAAFYPVMNRGDCREFIFQDDSDPGLFLKTMDELCQKATFQIHAFRLKPSHYHTVLETPSANFITGMRWLMSTSNNG